MPTQLLIYERAAPVTKNRHGEWSVKIGGTYEFSKNVNSVPVMAVEIPPAGADYAIVFAGSENAVMPVSIFGVRDRENLYVGDEGEWTGGYVPAFLRRYPFVFSSSDDGKTFTLCIDEEFSGCNTEGRGERLFDADGERTRYLENVLEFLKEYQAQFQRTQAFCAKLQELDLLEPMQAQFNLAEGGSMALTGFLAVNRDKLKALSGDQLAELARNDSLELIYSHLVSMRHLSEMAKRLPADARAAAGEAASEDADAEAEA